MAYSFTTQGSTPQTVGGFSQSTPATIGSTSASRALNNVGNSQSSQNSLAPGQFGQGSMPAYKPPVAPEAPTNQPVKSHTVSSDGTVVQTYHPPTAGLIDQTPQKSTTTDANTSQSATPTFAGIIGSLNQNSQVGSPAAGVAAQGLLSAPSQNSQVSQRAEDIRNLYGGQIAKVGSLGAGAKAGDLSTGTNIVGEGNAAIASQSASERMNALANDEAQEINALNPQLTAQGQAQSALTSAGGLGNTAQGLLQSGLTSAGQLAQPSPTSQGQTTYNPLTNSFSGGSYGNNLQTVVDSIKSGNMGYTDGVNSLASLSPTAKADVLAALGQGFDTVASDANASTRGGVLTQQGTQVEQYKSALQQGQNLKSQLSDLITSFGLNPNDLNAANSGLQKIAQNTSSPQYKILSNYVNDIANTYSQVLTPPGGSATDTTRGIATNMLDATASGKSLLQVMNSLDEAAKAKIAGVKTLGSTQASSSSTNGASVSGFGWNGD